MNDPGVQTVSRRIMDTTVKMADRDHLWVESVVIDETCDFVFESVVHLATKEIVRARGELKCGVDAACCERPIRNLPKLTGIAFGPGLVRKSGEILGSYDGCGFVMDAIVDMILDTTRYLNAIH